MVKFKTEYEKEMGIKFSKRGIIEFVEGFINYESSRNKEDPRTAKQWEEKSKNPGISMYLKKGGSFLNSTQPFMRTESSFNKNIKMDKLLKIIFLPEHQLKWDKVL